MISVDLMSLCTFVNSVHLCKSVRKKRLRLAVGRFLSHREHGGHGGFSARINSWKVFSLTERTDLTELFGALFRAHRRPPAYRVHRAFQLLSLLKRDITKPTSFL